MFCTFDPPTAASSLQLLPIYDIANAKGKPPIRIERIADHAAVKNDITGSAQNDTLRGPIGPYIIGNVSSNESFFFQMARLCKGHRCNGLECQSISND